MKEIWKDIKDTDGRYQISNTGRVRDVKKDRLCRLETTQRGYLRVDLIINRKRVHKRVHRLVANHFLSNPDNLPQVDHINGNRQDNRVSNLRWVSIISNCTNIKERRFARAVALIDTNGCVKQLFMSERQAALSLGVNRTSVSGTCRGFQKTTAGVKVVYASSLAIS